MLEVTPLKGINNTPVDNTGVLLILEFYLGMLWTIIISNFLLYF